MTVAEACRLLGCKSEYQLAKRLKCSQSAITRWGRMLPEHRVKQVLALLEKAA